MPGITIFSTLTRFVFCFPGGGFPFLCLIALMFSKLFFPCSFRSFIESERYGLYLFGLCFHPSVTDLYHLSVPMFGSIG